MTTRTLSSSTSTAIATSSSTSTSMPTSMFIAARRVAVGVRFIAWLRGTHQTLKTHWIAMLAILVIWTLAFVRVFVDPTPRLPLVFNWTPSLPYHVALAHYGPRVLQRGDYILFAFDGQEQLRHPGLRHQPFFKRIAGLPGDLVQVQESSVNVNGKPMGLAKTHTFDRQPLMPIEAGVIPPGYYYVQGNSPDSFDSRYRSSGLVRASQIIATVRPLF